MTVTIRCAADPFPRPMPGEPAGVTESQQQGELARDDNSGGTAPGKAAAVGLGHESGSEEPAVDHRPTTGDDEDSDDQGEARHGDGFATDDVRGDAEYADGGGDVSANPIGGLGRDAGSGGEGAPGNEGGLGSD
jgi:hypothetical protein